MKKLSIMFVSLLALSMGSLFAEDVATKDSQTPAEKKYVFALQFQPLPITTLPVFGLYNLNATAQFAAGIGNAGVSAGITFGSAASVARAMGTTYTGADVSFSIIDLEAFYRFAPLAHPVKGTLDGFYIGPGFRYEILNGSYTGSTASAYQYGIFADVGYQWVNNGFVADLNIGGGNYFNTSATPYYFRFMFEMGFAL